MKEDVFRPRDLAEPDRPTIHMTALHPDITVNPRRRAGEPCMLGLRISVGNVLEWLAQGRTAEQVIAGYPELVPADLLACLAYAAARESCEVRLVMAAA